MSDNKWIGYGVLVLKVLLAAIFLAAGGAKLMGVEQMVATFEQLGFGQWFRYVTGLIEVGSAVLLFVPGMTGVAAALLVCTMIGAVITHLVFIGGSAVPALVLLAASGFLLYRNRADLDRFLGRTSAAA